MQHSGGKANKVLLYLSSCSHGQFHRDSLPRSGADYDTDPQDKLGNQIKREARLKARRANVCEAEGCNNFGSVS